MPRYRYPINFDASDKEKAREIADLIELCLNSPSSLADDSPGWTGANVAYGPLERRHESWYEESES